MAPGYSDWSTDRFIIEVCFFFSSHFVLSLDCVRVRYSLASSVISFLTDSVLFLHYLSFWQPFQDSRREIQCRLIKWLNVLQSILHVLKFECVLMQKKKPKKQVENCLEDSAKFNPFKQASSVSNRMPR